MREPGGLGSARGRLYARQKRGRRADCAADAGLAARLRGRGTLLGRVLVLRRAHLQGREGAPRRNRVRGRSSTRERLTGCEPRGRRRAPAPACCTSPATATRGRRRLAPAPKPWPRAPEHPGRCTRAAPPTVATGPPEFVRRKERSLWSLSCEEQLLSADPPPLPGAVATPPARAHGKGRPERVTSPKTTRQRRRAAAAVAADFVGDVHGRANGRAGGARTRDAGGERQRRRRPVVVLARGGRAHGLHQVALPAQRLGRGVQLRAARGVGRGARTRDGCAQPFAP